MKKKNYTTHAECHPKRVLISFAPDESGSLTPTQKDTHFAILNLLEILEKENQHYKGE